MTRLAAAPLLAVAIAGVAAAQPRAIAPERGVALSETIGGAIRSAAVAGLAGAREGEALLLTHAGPGTSAALVDVLVGGVAGSLEHDARFRSVARERASEPADAAVGAALARGYEAVVLVSVAIADAELSLRVEVHDSGPAFAGAVGAGRRLSADELRAPLDAQLRDLLGGVEPATAETVGATAIGLPGREYVALAGADLDGDGATEIVLATRERVDVVRLSIGPQGARRLVRILREPFPEDLPPATIRPPRAIGTAIVEDGGVLLRVSDHAAPLEVRHEGGALRLARVRGPCEREAAFPLADGCAIPVHGRDYFSVTLHPRRGADAPAAAVSSFYARARSAVRGADGSSTDVEVVATPRGRLAARIDREARGSVAGYGAAVAMADVDLDGRAEVLASTDRALGEGDQLTLLRIRDNGHVTTVWTSEEVPGSVTVAGAVDVDADGRIELVAVEEPAPGSSARARLWVVR